MSGLFSSDTMNATLLAMTNSAAESFIIMNSIFFGNSDIGISTIISETAFYALIIQGYFYCLADKNTLVDWWISTRDTLYIIIYVSALTAFLILEISLWNSIILLALYFVHVLLMKFNSIYEVAIKKIVARKFEL